MPHNILHLIDTGGPGGAETVFLELVDHLSDGCAQSIAVVPERGWLYGALRSRGIEPIVVSGRGSFDVKYLMRLFQLVQHYNVDLVQTHLLASAVYGSIVARLARIPAVCTFHGPADIAPDEPYRTAKFRILDRRVNRMVFVSESLRRYVRSVGRVDRAPTVVIPNGVDVNRFRPGMDRTVRGALGIGEDDVLVGAVGNVRISKDYPTLLRAAARLRRRSSTYRFVIVGDTGDPIYPTLIALRRELGLNDHVIFAGFRDDVEQVMMALDIYVTSSSAEGFSLTTAQALACGVPVVATRCGGPEEIIEHDRTGVLIQPGSPEALADAVDELTHAPHRRRQFARNGRETTERCFALDPMIRNYDELYDNCLRDCGSPFSRRAADPTASAQ